MLGRPTNLAYGRTRACSVCGLEMFIYFFLSPIISLFFLSLWDGWMDDVILCPFQQNFSYIRTMEG